ncbi:uncharacterized protein C19orf47 homolog isoform X2 [Patagioenas fasciata]|uniref:uncharacterized protein C19orf47 homolog isoform X2 n=1 Tax=Patagioenas fasciata TaxID=372321 RepID=UPI003A9A6263
MASVTMATSEWIQFFKEAGIPPGPAVNYAVMFVDNRIQKNMLLDLNKEIMNELGITVVGDIIAILKHAKVVYRQEMCKAATKSLTPASPTVQPEFRRNAASAFSRRSAAASRMIANSLRRESPPTPQNQPRASKISITVSNKLARAGLCDSADGYAAVPVKRRRVTAEMEGKYIINMPKGTTPRTKKILEQQAAKGLQRTSVFERLGDEAKADTTTGAKPTGVFSRLGATLPTDTTNPADSDDDCSVLQYAGVLKKPPKRPQKPSAEPGGPIKAKATSSQAKTTPFATKTRHLAPKPPPTAPKMQPRDDDVSSTKDKPPPEFRVTIKRTWGSAKVTSTSDGPGARMDDAGAVSVFQRLGRKAE